MPRIPEPGMEWHGPFGPVRPQAHKLPVPVGDTLGDWVGWWALGRCGCGSKDWPIGMLIRRYGTEPRLADVLSRMRCRDRCGERPRWAGLTDDIGDPRYYPNRRLVPVPGMAGDP